MQTYFPENNYSYFVRLQSVLEVPIYEADTPETDFELAVQQQFAQANEYIFQEEYRLALDAVSKLRGLILSVADPQLAPINRGLIDWVHFVDPAMIDPLMGVAVNVLQNTPITPSSIPTAVVSPQSHLPPDIQKRIQPFEMAGLQAPGIIQVSVLVNQAQRAASLNRWIEARDLYTRALQVVPADQVTIRAALTHDLAILHEKTGEVDTALNAAKQGISLFEEVRNFEAQQSALTTLAGMQQRAGQVDASQATLAEASDLSRKQHLFPIVFATSLADIGLTTHQPAPASRPSTPATVQADGNRSALADGPVQLLAPAIVSQAQATRSLTLLTDDNTAISILLDQNGAANLKGFYQTRIQTSDLGLIYGWSAGYPILMGYLPHMYFFVLPMAMGDCYAAMGDFTRAEQQYLSVLVYPYINQTFEILKLWTRLADLYLDWGDQLYRAARDDAASFSAARQMYERIVRTDNTVDPNSPLYQDPKFAGILNRVKAILAAANVLTLDENPALISRVLRAQQFLQQIAANLNYFGLDANFLPPFSFEYLQNIARYFAQHAMQVEQQYIQFKSQAENEEFRREQLEQQAEVASASVDLEQRNVDEANAGAAVAKATLNYAQVGLTNAQQAQNDFNNARWELLELSELEAWSSAASVGQDDEVQQTISGYTYYNTTNTRRSVVLQDLAAKRTRLSQDLEANRLQREVNSAQAYTAVAQAQVQQAQARVAVAQQRVVIAQMQQRFAEQNRDFLDMQEFSAKLWFELAREARRIVRRYLDAAIEIAFLMERAYFAETGRDLRLIKFDYGQRQTDNLLGAEALLLDIDTFTLDYARTRSKKAQFKQIISIADTFPIAFDRLKRTGQMFFETSLDMFDRAYPGFYLHKVKDVELVFVGLTNASGLYGTLRNVGVSHFRSADGSINTLAYPSDVMPLSQYEIRQDAVVFQYNPNELRLFENNGVATQWRIDLPLATNDLDFNEILDIQLVLYYDAFFSPTLEATILATLPTSGSASRGISMSLYTPDELFYLRNQGSGLLTFDASIFPLNEVNLQRKRVVIQASGDSATVGNLKLRVDSANLGSRLEVPLDAQGLADSNTAGSPLAALLSRLVFDGWTLSIDPTENPGLVKNGKLDLSGLRDLSAFLEYSFDYRK
jgi:hypothetical protein